MQQQVYTNNVCESNGHTQHPANNSAAGGDGDQPPNNVGGGSGDGGGGGSSSNGNDAPRNGVSGSTPNESKVTLDKTNQDIVRLIAQHLKEIGLERSADLLMTESGCSL